MSSKDGEKPPKRSLLEKYEIPVEYLDFAYIKSCNNPRMVERIVKILRSGEEGFFPDLTKCAEERLKELKPTSKLFRTETAAIKKEHLDDDQREQIENDIKSFIDDIKQHDKVFSEIKPKKPKSEPPIRKQNVKGELLKNKPSERIKSTDYNKWDKYDADAAELKIELDEERQKEIVEAKNKKNSEKAKLIEVIDDEADELTEFERDRLSLKFKERGNEAVRAKDYEEALREYSQSIKIKKTAAALNNRALVHLKLKNYIKVISDTNECLQLEPTNIKALLRKAQAFLGQNMTKQAYETYEKVLQIDGSNQTAQHEIIKLADKMPQRKVTRMKIEEVEDVKEEPKSLKKGKSEKLDIPESSHVPDLVKNIVPDEKTIFDKLKPEEPKKREKLIMPADVQDKSTKKGGMLIEEIN